MRVRQAAKRDMNEQAIVQALRKAGASVERLSGSRGLPDLLVAYKGANWLVEVKSERGKLTRHQAAWRLGWQGPVHMVRSVEDALRQFIRPVAWS